MHTKVFHTFSVNTMIASLNSGELDMPYFEFFKKTCFERIDNASVTISAIVDGHAAIGSETETDARAAIASIRHSMLALAKCAMASPTKDSMERFHQALSERNQAANAAEAAFVSLEEIFTRRRHYDYGKLVKHAALGV